MLQPSESFHSFQLRSLLKFRIEHKICPVTGNVNIRDLKTIVTAWYVYHQKVGALFCRGDETILSPQLLQMSLFRFSSHVHHCKQQQPNSRTTMTCQNLVVVKAAQCKQKICDVNQALLIYSMPATGAQIHWHISRRWSIARPWSVSWAVSTSKHAGHCVVILLQANIPCMWLQCICLWWTRWRHWKPNITLHNACLNVSISTYIAHTEVWTAISLDLIRPIDSVFLLTPIGSRSPSTWF